MLQYLRFGLNWQYGVSAALFLMTCPMAAGQVTQNIPLNAVQSEISPSPPQSKALSVSSVIHDLHYLQDVWVPKERSFTNSTREEVLTFISDQIAHAHSMQRSELALIFSEAQALSANNHTQTNYFREEGLFTNLPISFWLFPDGAFITRTQISYRRLLGANILRIGGVPIIEAERRVAKYIAGTDEHRRYASPAWLTRLEVLESLGLAHDRRALFDVQTVDGKFETIPIGAAATADPAALSPPWQQSIVPGKGPAPWPHVLDAVSELPLYLRPRDELSATDLNDSRLLYIRSTSLDPYTDDPDAVLLKAYMIVDNIFKKQRFPTNIIVDLRFNEGGNFMNIVDFANELAGLVRRNGQIYIITGRATNSAAIIFTALLRASLPTRTRIVGEKASDNLWFWSEGGMLRAPSSNLPIHYTDGYHDWAHGCSDWVKCYWPAIFHGVAVGSIDPDIKVEPTYQQYASGKDVALEAILATIKSDAP